MKEPARRRMLCWALLLVAVALGGATVWEWQQSPFALGRHTGQREIAGPAGNGVVPQKSEEVFQASLTPPRERLQTGVECWVFQDGDHEGYVETFYGWRPEEQRVMTGSSHDGEGILRLPDGSEERVLPAEGDGLLVSVYSIEQAEWIRQSLSKHESLLPRKRIDLVLSSHDTETVDEAIRIRMNLESASNGIEMEIQFEGEGTEKRRNAKVSLQDGQSFAYTIRPAGSGEFKLYLIEATLTP